MKRFISFFLCAILIFAIVGCSSVNKWQEKYDLGIRYLNDGNYTEAIIAFTAAIEIDPNNASSYENRANAYLKLADEYIENGDYQSANEMYELALLDCEQIQNINENIDISKIKNKMDKVEKSINEGLKQRAPEPSFVKITNVDSFPNGNEVEYHVTVDYKCPENESCLLMIGANIREPDLYSMFDNDVFVSSEGTETIKCSVIPVNWDNEDFKLYVNLSAADHEESWSPYAYDTYVVGS